MRNCITFAFRLWWRRRKSAHGLARVYFPIARWSDWGLFWHWLYQERSRHGRTWTVSYKPVSPKRRPFPPPSFNGYVCWGDKKLPPEPEQPQEGITVKPWLIVGALVAWFASLAGAFSFGQTTKVDAIEAQAARENAVADRAIEAANRSAAAAIARLRPIYTTIQQETEREIRTNTVYRDCRHPAEQLRRLNAALAGPVGAESAGGGLVPRADAFER